MYTTHSVQHKEMWATIITNDTGRRIEPRRPRPA